MLSIPGRNLHNYIKKKPPETLMAVCLIVFALCVLYFAYYVRLTDKVLNKDAQEDWTSLFKYLNKRDYCIVTNAPQRTDDSNLKHVNVPARVSLPDAADLKSPLKVYGAVSLNDYTPNCPVAVGASSEAVTFAFDVPKLNRSGGAVVVDVCVGLGVPVGFLRSFTHPECRESASFLKAGGELVSVYPRSDTFCTNGTRGMIKLDEDSSQFFEIYLTERERVKVHIHLLWLTSFVLFIIIIMLCCAMFTRPNEEQP